MATVKVLRGASSSSGSFYGFRSLFYCCFSSSSSSGKEEDEEAKRKIEDKRKQDDGTIADKTAEANVEMVDTDDGTGRENSRVANDQSRHTTAMRDTSDRDRGSAVGDDLRDSAIDNTSISSQGNLRGSVDGEAMRGGEPTEVNEQNRSLDNRNYYVTKQDDVVNPSESNSIGDASDLHGATPDFSLEGVDVADGCNTSPAALMEEQEDRLPEADNPVTQCGRIRLTFEFDSNRHRLCLTVHEAGDVPDHDRVNLSHSEIHLLLTQQSKKIRHQTRAKSGENPRFEEKFRFKISSDELIESGLRVRLYRTERFKKERMIGESCLPLSNLPLDNNAPFSTWVTLQPRFNLNTILGTHDQTDGAGGDVDVCHTSVATSGPVSELMLGMKYNIITGRLSVEVIQGCNIRSLDSQKPPDTYVKLRLISPSGQEIGKSKTTVRRCQPNPHYKETFVFHVSESQLPDVSLMVSVCESHNMKKNKLLGWFTLGHTNTTEETKKHWTAMIERNGEQINCWHSLLSP